MSAVRTALLSGVILVAGVGVMAAATQGFRSFTGEAALRVSVQEAPRAVPDVPLQDAAGRAVRLADFRGQWLLASFIYTHCTTICSAQGSVYLQMERLLAKPIAEGRVRLVSISFDPRRDTPQALARYRDRFGDATDTHGWTLLRPLSADALVRLKQTFGVKVIADGLGGFEHNAAINLIDPSGRLIAVLDWDDLSGAVRLVRHHVS